MAQEQLAFSLALNGAEEGAGSSNTIGGRANRGGGGGHDFLGPSTSNGGPNPKMSPSKTENDGNED